MRATHCLIITDIQNDFCPGGALPVAGGDEIIPLINKISTRFDKVVATRDWHPPGHISFASSHGKQPYEEITIIDRQQVLWPDHCIEGTFGAEFHKDFDLRPVDVILHKGSNPYVDAYSAFIENDRVTKTGLQYCLWGLEIKYLYVCGLATDYCVYSTALDAAALGFKVTVIIDACKGVDNPAGNIAKVIDKMREHRIIVETHDMIWGGGSV